MSDGDSQLMRLQDLQQFLASAGLEESLDEQARQAARLIDAQDCSILLLNSGEGQALRMTVFARHGGPADGAALQASVGKGEGICGQVLASGQSLLVPDIAGSPYAQLARRPDGPRSLVAAPVRVDGRIVGVINASGHRFSQADLHLLEVIALFIGKSIQVTQLQRLLDSRFAQLALLQEAQQKVGQQVRTAYRNPGDAARILARSFFREMTKAGFDSGQIVSAASELIEQLNRQLQPDGRAGPPPEENT